MAMDTEYAAPPEGPPETRNSLVSVVGVVGVDLGYD